MIRKLLVANRGEIALRVMRTAKEMGIATVAVYSDLDREALHVRYADESYALDGASPAQTYLNAEKILAIAARADADGLHPGYGFFAENAAFAQQVLDAGLVWVGPNPGAIEEMGDKLRSRQAMVAAGVPVVPGGVDPVLDAAEARRAAEEFGLPLALKAAGGGGGKGLKVAYTLDEIASAFTTAQREAEAYFKNGTIYVERYLENPKHVELQLLADKHGTVLHVGERECSLQRRHQKLLEESPPTISERVRAGIRDAGIRAAQAIGYDSAGTIECLVAGDEFFFLEMNTRIQVEHTVSEMISGLDLVREQIRAACGEPLGYGQDAIALRGHAIEVRVNAEDPARQFAPVPGTLTTYVEPGGPGVRVDSAAFPGFTVAPDYDSMIAKLIVWAPTRDGARARLRRAIDEFKIEGVPTTLPVLRALVDEPSVVDGSYGTATLEPFAERFAAQSAAAAAAAAPARDLVEAEVVRVEVNGKLFTVRLLDAPRGASVTATRRPPPPVAPKRNAEVASENAIVAPMHGVVVEISVKAGDEVEPGTLVAVIEAMKMMNE
ncbi:MAG: carbamoyl phosphate synthase, partial [Candidatus Eremiobacteraeota bacterium]|nr:carbamoyl phosphate synthase [Candidatus Eremiobacteraeota bacterium]